MNAPLNLISTANPFDVWFQPVEALKGLSMMDHLYNRLDGAYPHKWRSNFPNTDAIDNWKVSWAEAFEEEGITPNDIRAGLKACRSKYDWPPSCAEFIKACRPSIDPMVAYYEAVAGCQARSKGEVGEWSHPAIFWAARTLSHDLLSQTYSQVKVRWELSLAEQMEKAEWEEIPKPMKQLAAPGRGDLSREKAAELIREHKAEGVIKTETSRVDHLRWAREIMKRHEKKDRSVPMVSLKNAREALGIQ
ncbi:MAG: hypothetical protein JWP38_3721 [Herbaspirillum sp.]|nr:hypothetical protein [Herbaspirillum sp.]